MLFRLCAPIVAALNKAARPSTTESDNPFHPQKRALVASPMVLASFQPSVVVNSGRHQGARDKSKQRV